MVEWMGVLVTSLQGPYIWQEISNFPHFTQNYLQHVLYKIKGTVNVIASDPPFQDDNARFTTVPLKALSDQV